MTRAFHIAALLFALFTVGATRSTSAAGDGPRAAGGEGLLSALEAAPAVLVGTVGDVARIDLHGYAAHLQVEQVLRGVPKPGARVRIAWEELARSRQPRFANADRVLLALETLPGASLWRQRFPDVAERRSTFAVAERAEAFWRRPTQAAIDIIAHFLALDAASRSGAAGVEYLAQLLAGSEVGLSLAAVRRLDAIGDLDAKLGPAAAHALIRALLRPDGTDPLRVSVLDLIGRHSPHALQGPLEELAAAQPLAPAIVFVALGRLQGEIGAERSELLFAQDAAHRRAAARHTHGPQAAKQLADLLRADPDAGVREAAVARLIELAGRDGMGPALDTLSDRDPRVRLAAAGALASLGEQIVPELVAVVETGSREAALAGVAGLKAVGEAGQPVLLEIARDHPDEGVRTLARVALGGSLDDHHRH